MKDIFIPEEVGQVGRKASWFQCLIPHVASLSLSDCRGVNISKCLTNMEAFERQQCVHLRLCYFAKKKTLKFAQI